jgi:hypothetical protein
MQKYCSGSEGAVHCGQLLCCAAPDVVHPYSSLGDQPLALQALDDLLLLISCSLF